MNMNDYRKCFPEVWFLLGVICFALQWLTFRNTIYADHPSLAGTLFKGLAEGALILSWYWLLSPKHRWWLQVPLWISGLLFLSNTLYFRVFGDIIPLASVTMTDNFNLLFFRSCLALLKWSDLLVLLMPMCLSLVYFSLFRKSLAAIKFNKQTKMIAFAVCFIIWGTQQTIYIKGNKSNPFVASALERGEKGLSWSDAVVFQYIAPNFHSRINDLHARGLLVYSFREIYRGLLSGTSTIELDANQRHMIEGFLDSRPSDYPLPLAFDNRDSMNVILIIVESLNSWAIDLNVDDVEVTPNLNKMRRLPTTIYVSDVIAQTRDGGSSDGQLMYDTGLHPLTRGAAAMTFTANAYPSLAKCLARDASLLFIGDNRKVWNYDNSSKQYGYDRLYDEVDLRDANLDPLKLGKDKAIFTYAADVLVNTPQPFFAEIITLSMHLPFREESSGRIDAFDNSGHSSTFKDYVTSVRFFDQQFESFVDKLKAAGIYENTLIFLAADHEILVQDGGREDGFGNRIPFIALNAGVSAPKIPGDVYQTDIYPTMLDIAGKGNSKWKGLGTSIFANGYRENMTPHDVDQAQEVSDLIIRGSYF